MLSKELIRLLINRLVDRSVHHRRNAETGGDLVDFCIGHLSVCLSFTYPVPLLLECVFLFRTLVDHSIASGLLEVLGGTLALGTVYEVVGFFVDYAVHACGDAHVVGEFVDFCGEREGLAWVVHEFGTRAEIMKVSRWGRKHTLVGHAVLQ